MACLRLVLLSCILFSGITANAQQASPVTVLGAARTDEVDEAIPTKPGDNSLAADAKYRVKVIDFSKLKTEQSGVIETKESENPDKLPPRVEIIVDSSGSMGQMLSLDRTRMYFMKKMLTRYFIDQFKQKAETGLRVYGSRRRGDCSDNELMVGFNERSLAKIESLVAQLEPVGKTPLYRAVQAAALDLKSYKGPKAMIVFTDGEDTCGGSPCKEGKIAAVDPYLNVQIYVVAIGFKPEGDDIKSVSCLGETTTANSEDELFSALGGITQKIFSKQINLRVNSPDPTAEVQLFHEVDGEWRHLRSFTSAFGTTVPPGKYQAVVLLNPAYRFETFEIPPKKSVTLTVGGTGQLQVDFLNRILDVEIMDKNMKSVMKFKSDTPTQVPIGRWTIKISKPPFYEKFVSRYDVHPNGKYNYKVTAAGAVKVAAKELTGLYVYDSKNNLMGNYLTNFPFVLPAGEYKVHVNASCSFPVVNSKDDGKLNILKCK